MDHEEAGIFPVLLPKIGNMPTNLSEANDMLHTATHQTGNNCFPQNCKLYILYIT
jgi:hypothetical protein